MLMDEDRVWKRPVWGGHAAGFTALPMLAERTGYKRLPFLLRGKGEKETRGGKREGRTQNGAGDEERKKEMRTGKEKERNPERGGGVGRKAMMYGRSPASQPSAPSAPSPRPSLARLEIWGSRLRRPGADIPPGYPSPAQATPRCPK